MRQADPDSAPVASMHECNQCMDQLTKLTDEFADRINRIVPRINRTATSDEILTIISKLADNLTPIVERYSVQASNYVSITAGIDQETQTRLRVVNATSRDQWSEDTVRYLERLKRLAESSLNGVNGAQALSNGLDGLKGRSPRLDEPVQRL